MSISTEITRLQNAKASIKTSIENKGVTVPSATKLDGYSTLIDSIQTGSSIDYGADKQFNIAQLFHRISTGECVTGTFTLASALPNTEREIFDTGLSVVHGCAYIDLTFNTYQTTTTPEFGIFGYYQKNENTYAFNAVSLNGNSSIGSVAKGGFLVRVSSYRWDGGKLIVKASFGGNANYTPFYPNHEYRWIAWGETE